MESFRFLIALISPIQAGIKKRAPYKGIRQLPLLLRERIQNAPFVLFNRSANLLCH
jgi:hypothetical protein